MLKYLDENTEHVARLYQTSLPFPHVMIAGAIDEPTLRSAVAHWPAADDPSWRRFACGKSATVMRKVPQALLEVLDAVNSPASVAWLEQVTGIRGLVADPDLSGGGLHEVAPGGFLQLHVDFNRLHGLYRRLNVLMYLNDDWPSSYGGDLELRADPKDPASESRTISPLFNRMVVAESSERSWHGHPRPVACPEGRSRRSLAWYFYTAEPGPGYVHDHSTIYCDRKQPQERITEAERERRKASRVARPLKPRDRRGKMEFVAPWRFPDKKPDVAPDLTSLLADTTAVVLQGALSSSTRCVVELGSFLGASTRLILSSAPNATVYAIDHWRGPASMHRPHMAEHRHRIPTLFETFQVNCWHYRDRLRPVRMDTVEGVKAVAEYLRLEGLPTPDVVFIDADHEPVAVWRDMAAAAKAWPRAVLVGDDWEAKAGGGGLAKAVQRFARKRKRKLSAFGNGWRMEP